MLGTTLMQSSWNHLRVSNGELRDSMGTLKRIKEKNPGNNLKQ